MNRASWEGTCMEGEYDAPRREELEELAQRSRPHCTPEECHCEADLNYAECDECKGDYHVTACKESHKPN